MYETSPLLKEKAEIEKSLEIHRSELARIRSELNAMSRTIEESEQKIQQNKTELENKAKEVLSVELEIV
jgi:phage shock protein A